MSTRHHNPRIDRIAELELFRTSNAVAARRPVPA
jgi:hypothetical protein